MSEFVYINYGEEGYLQIINLTYTFQDPGFHFLWGFEAGFKELKLPDEYRVTLH